MKHLDVVEISSTRRLKAEISHFWMMICIKWFTYCKYLSDFLKWMVRKVSLKELSFTFWVFSAFSSKNVIFLECKWQNEYIRAVWRVCFFERSSNRFHSRWLDAWWLRQNCTTIDFTQIFVHIVRKVRNIFHFQSIFFKKRHFPWM